jgi:hypothetical protein
LVDRGKEFGGGDDAVHSPTVGGADVQVLDQREDMAVAAEVISHLGHAVVIDSAF